MKNIQTQVLIVGAGPVGLTAAMDLASRGIDVVVAEIRPAGEPPNVKCNHVSARSMEVFRRLGIVREVREGGLPADFPNDCAYRTAVVGRELTRIPIPCRADRYTATGGPEALLVEEEVVDAIRRERVRERAPATRHAGGLACDGRRAAALACAETRVLRPFYVEARISRLHG